MLLAAGMLMSGKNVNKITYAKESVSEYIVMSKNENYKRSSGGNSQ